MTDSLRLLRVQQVPALDLLAFSTQFGQARHAPDLTADAEVRLQQLRSGDDLQQDRAAAQQLHMLAFALLHAG
ncbi:hypothetical protein D3C78_1542730 [compost metagenome]